MDLYLDTSVVVAAITNEPFTARAHAVLAVVDRVFVVSDWTVTEVAAALSMKRRTGGLRPIDRELAQRVFRRLLSESLERERVMPADFERAAEMAERVEPAVRSGDSLHLAVVERLGVALCTFDRTMARAATARGIDVVE